MARAHCMLDTWGYKHTLRVRTTYCISNTTMVAPTRLLFTSTWPACLVFNFVPLTLLPNSGLCDSQLNYIVLQMAHFGSLSCHLCDALRASMETASERHKYCWGPRRWDEWSSGRWSWLPYRNRVPVQIPLFSVLLGQMVLLGSMYWACEWPTETLEV